jgi:putative PEP-CTERM system TPR-repeat lipoprotein
MNMHAVAPLLLSAALTLAAAGCSESVESLVAGADASFSKGDFRTAQIQLKAALQQDPRNARARWLLGELNLATENGADAEKELRRAGELGVGNDAVIPAIAQALLLQNKADAVFELTATSDLSPRAQGELMAARGLAHITRRESKPADELTAEALKLAPSSAFAKTARARVHAAAGRLDEAEQLLVALQQAQPTYGLAWSLLGDIQDVRGDLPKAEQAYSVALEKRPVPVRDLLKRAQVRLRQKNFDGALADAQRLTEAFPKLQPAWYVVGAAHFFKKEFPKAQEALDRSSQLDGDHVPTLILLGWANLNAGNLAQASLQASRAAALAPNLVGARLLMATVDLREQRPQHAEEMVRPVVDAFPDNLPAKGLLIASLQAQGKRAEAAPLLEQVAAATPESLDVQAAVGLDLLRAKEPDKALAILGRAVRQAPAAPRVNEALVVALIQDKKYDEALAAAQRFHDQNRGDPAGLRLLGAAQVAKGERAAAKATFRKALDVTPGDPALSVNLAELLRRDGDLAGARVVIAQASQMRPDDAGLLNVLAQIALQQDQGTEAVDLLRKALAKSPGHRLSQVLLSRQLLTQNDAKGALAVLPTDRELSDAAVLALRADANLRLNEAAAARDDLEQLVRLLPRSAEAQFNLAIAHAALGDRARMETALDEAGKLDPKNASIGVARARVLAQRGKPDEAAALAKSLALAESDPRLLATERAIAEAKGDKAGEVRAAERLLAAAPSTDNALMLAKVQAAAGQAEAAERTLRDWVDRHPDADAAALALAALYGRSGRAGDAAAVLRPLAKKAPDDAVVQNNLAWYLRESAPKESLALAEKASAAAPDNPAILETYATVLALNGQYDKALRAIDAAIAKARQPVYYQLQKVEILVRSGDTAAAVGEFEAVRAGGVPQALRPMLEALERRLGSP